jgi:hypothetical protein
LVNIIKKIIIITVIAAIVITGFEIDVFVTTEVPIAVMAQELLMSIAFDLWL